MNSFHLLQFSRIQRPARRLLLALLCVWLAACSVARPFITGLPPTQDTAPANPAPAEAQRLPETEVIFRVAAPDNTPADTALYLSLVDEVTGLALNTRRYPMQAEEPSEGQRTYTLKIPLAVGSSTTYRYERQAGSLHVAEHLSDGRPVRYRVVHVEGPATIEDVVSRWTDTPFISPTGRITGQAQDAGSGSPIPGLMIAAGGMQTFTAGDGSFLLEGLPPGVHNLVALAPDGAYRTYQQGARVAEGLSTPAPLQLSPAPRVQVSFLVQLPGNTPPVVPVRLAGSLYGTGNTFADLAGGVSSLATQMPVLSPQPDGRYALTLSLPAGADLHYKYTLGDGFWNAERTGSGRFRLRQLVVPDHDVQIEDQVESWMDGENQPVTFDLVITPETPSGDTVFIQFDPLFGWTEPLPMWKLADQRWAYILFSPLNLPGEVRYRYCRNGQCNVADEAASRDQPGRTFTPQSEGQTIKDQVPGWIGLNASTEVPPGTAQAEPRGAGFSSGVEFQPAYRPSWQAQMPAAMQVVQEMGGSWVVLSPTWSFVQRQPPVLEALPGHDMLWADVVQAVQQGQEAGLQVGMYPQPSFPMDASAWWAEAPRDFAWWESLFAQYQVFALNYARLAEASRASALILGGPMLEPALPDGRLPGGEPSGVPGDAGERWGSLLQAVRSQYSGPIWWALPAERLTEPPAFLDEVDGLYVLWADPHSGQGDPQQVETDLVNLLDGQVRSAQLLYDQPVVLAALVPSADLGGQARVYDVLARLVDERSWINGLVARGFYPPAALQDPSPSIHGKPAGEVLGRWFKGWR